MIDRFMIAYTKPTVMWFIEFMLFTFENFDPLMRSQIIHYTSSKL